MHAFNPLRNSFRKLQICCAMFRSAVYVKKFRSKKPKQCWDLGDVVDIPLCEG